MNDYWQYFAMEWVFSITFSGMIIHYVCNFHENYLEEWLGLPGKKTFEIFYSNLICNEIYGVSPAIER